MSLNVYLQPSTGDHNAPVDLDHLLRQLNDSQAAGDRAQWLYVHGESGIGKSTLLRLLREHYSQAAVPVGHAVGDAQLTDVDLLKAWTQGLGEARFPTFNRHYDKWKGGARGAQLGVAKDNPLKEIVAGLAEIGSAWVATYNPPLSALLKTVGVLAHLVPTRQLVDAGARFANQDHASGLILTADFLHDLGNVPGPLLFTLDGLEHVAHLSPWLSWLFTQLPDRVQLVFTSRYRPKGVMPSDQIAIYELQPLDTEAMRATATAICQQELGGEPEPAVLDELIQFARGIPLAAEAAVQALKAGRPIRLEAPRALVSRLLQGTPAELVPVVEAAAMLRSFNQDALADLAGPGAREHYDTLLDNYPMVPDPSGRGYALVDRWQYWLRAELKVRSPREYSRLHQLAQACMGEFVGGTSEVVGEILDRQRQLDQLFHLVSANEIQGMEAFQQLAQSLTDGRKEPELEQLVQEAGTWPLLSETSQLWIDYYKARLADLRQQYTTAEAGYRRVIASQSGTPLLWAYAYCDLGIRLMASSHAGDPGYPRPARDALQAATRLGVMDHKLVHTFFNMMFVFEYDGRWEKALQLADQARAFLLEQKPQDYQFELASLGRNVKPIYGKMGHWHEMFQFEQELLRQVPTETRYLAQRERVSCAYAIGGTWAGQYTKTEQSLQQTIHTLNAVQGKIFPALLYDLGMTIGMQGRYLEAEDTLRAAEQMILPLPNRVWGQAIIDGYRGRILLRRGYLTPAEEYLRQTLADRERLQSNGTMGWIPELVTWLGETLELKGDLAGAEAQYRRVVDEMGYLQRHYYDATVRVALVRIALADGRLDEAAQYWDEAFDLAQAYEYNDHLATLYLLQGHAAWDGTIPTWGSGFDAAHHAYQKALIYALRYNRFHLDAILTGRYDPVADPTAADRETPYRPLIAFCQERGSDGRRMLKALQDWWRRGQNEIDGETPPQVTLLSDGGPLVTAEREARRNELGDGRPQVFVLDHLKAALSLPVA